MSRKRTLAETDANVERIEVHKKIKIANKKSKESPVRVLFRRSHSVPMVANNYSEGRDENCSRYVSKDSERRYSHDRNRRRSL